MSTGIASQPPRGILSRLNAFFYSEEVPYGLALMRISVSIALLLAMVPRWAYARELYSSDGSPVPVWEIYGLKPLFAEPSAEAAIAIHSVLLLACLASCLGWCTRFSMILAAAGYIYLNSLDTIGTMNKYSVIASHLMLLMCFSDCGAVWSLDNWFRRSRLRRAGVPPEIANQPRSSPAWPRRLLQLCVGLVYFGAVLTKVKIPAYFSGEQLQTWMITNYNMPNLLGRYFEPYPAILAGFGLVALIWECTFIFLAWRGIPRIVMLAIGSTFHIMTLLTLGLWLFPVVCISSYLAFLNEADVAWFKQLFARWRERGGGFAPRWASCSVRASGRCSRQSTRPGRKWSLAYWCWRRPAAASPWNTSSIVTGCVARKARTHSSRSIRTTWPNCCGRASGFATRTRSCYLTLAPELPRARSSTAVPSSARAT